MSKTRTKSLNNTTSTLAPRVVHSGSTYNVGRTKAKNKAYAYRTARRLAFRMVKASDPAHIEALRLSIASPVA